MNRGVTLIELVTALAILGVVLGMSGVALASLRVPQEWEATRELQRARAAAIRTGRPVRAVARADTGANRSPLPSPLFLPDGRAVGPGVDPLTGAPHATR